ncbi:MAG: hypothetical protein ACREOI_21650 [bacterium]
MDATLPMNCGGDFILVKGFHPNLLDEKPRQARLGFKIGLGMTAIRHKQGLRLRAAVPAKVAIKSVLLLRPNPFRCQILLKEVQQLYNGTNGEAVQTFDFEIPPGAKTLNFGYLVDGASAPVTNRLDWLTPIKVNGKN